MQEISLPPQITALLTQLCVCVCVCERCYWCVQVYLSNSSRIEPALQKTFHPSPETHTSCSLHHPFPPDGSGHPNMFDGEIPLQRAPLEVLMADSWKGELSKSFGSSGGKSSAD